MPSNYQVTVPELSTIKSEEPPIFVIATNHNREIYDTLKCHSYTNWIDYLNIGHKLEIVRGKVPELNLRLWAEADYFI